VGPVGKDVPKVGRRTTYYSCLLFYSIGNNPATRKAISPGIVFVDQGNPLGETAPDRLAGNDGMAAKKSGDGGGTGCRARRIFASVPAFSSGVEREDRVYFAAISFPKCERSASRTCRDLAGTSETDML
jgi:hypothetical protein